MVDHKCETTKFYMKRSVDISETRMLLIQLRVIKRSSFHLCRVQLAVVTLQLSGYASQTIRK